MIHLLAVNTTTDRDDNFGGDSAPEFHRRPIEANPQPMSVTGARWRSLGHTGTPKTEVSATQIKLQRPTAYW
jgi:hypothetical protein